jgi:SpoU rRNA methylase family enzyme
MYLQEIEDAIELISPDEVYLFIKRPFSKENFNPNTIVESYNEGKTILLIFGGADPGITKRELELGVPVYFNRVKELGCLGEVTLSLYLLRNLIEEED